MIAKSGIAFAKACSGTPTDQFLRFFMQQHQGFVERTVCGSM
jgi:hypothetical protein